ncbi:MAG: DUF881 domain-containing protein [Anaerolineae bacterium]
MLSSKWAARLTLTTTCLVLGLMLVVQLRSQSDARQALQETDWEYAVVDLIDNNARLREEIDDLEAQLAELRQEGGSTAILQSLVNEANQLRIANGLVEVSGPGIEVDVEGPITVLDLHDLINEVRNAGAEALALNGQRLVAWSAISTDGTHVTVDGQPIQPPYRLEAIGDGESLETALLRPGGLVELLERLDERITLAVRRRDKLTLTDYAQPMAFVYARPAD